MDQLNRPLEQTSFDDAFMFQQASRDGQTQNWLKRNDDAWVPFGGISPTDLHPPPDFVSNCANPNAFLEYRSAGIRSECETVPGDSGYGSLFDNTSNYDESFGAPVPNLDRDIPEFKLSLQPHESFYGHVESQSGYANTSTATETRYYCDGCNSSVKTKSELKKHALRHTKPFRCQHRECVDKDRGFASQNDLDRHLRTVHKVHALGKTYFCNLDNCARRTKPWPRADNFRSHLQRVHKLQVSADADLSQYLHQSPQPRPIAEDLSGIGTQLQEAPDASVAQNPNPNYSPPNPMRDFPDIETQSGQPHHHPLRPATQVSLEGLLPPNSHHSQPAFMPSNSLDPSIAEYQLNSGSVQGQASPAASDQLQAPRRFLKQEVVSPNPDSHSFSQGAAQDINMDSDRSSVSEEESDSKDIPDLPNIKGSSTENQPALLEYLRGLPPHLLKEALSNATDSETKTEQSPASTAGKSSCDKCQKTFNRPCELRKHIKRHERPYGCTVPRCTKKFGSKNDWKRHERGQHSNTEVWRCDQAGCLYFSYQRGELDTHLRSYHHITDSAIIDRKLESLRRGSHCVDDFWCGFCKDLIKIDPKTSDVVDERFDHIDNHFMGRDDWSKADIDSWCHPESYFEKALHQEHSAQTKKRKSHQAQTSPRPRKQLHPSSK